jgi:hypothetical protein
MYKIPNRIHNMRKITEDIALIESFLRETLSLERMSFYGKGYQGTISTEDELIRSYKSALYRETSIPELSLFDDDSIKMVKVETSDVIYKRYNTFFKNNFKLIEHFDTLKKYYHTVESKMSFSYNNGDEVAYILKFPVVFLDSQIDKFRKEYNKELDLYRGPLNDMRARYEEILCSNAKRLFGD